MVFHISVVYKCTAPIPMFIKEGEVAWGVTYKAQIWLQQMFCLLVCVPGLLSSCEHFAGYAGIPRAHIPCR